MLSRLLLALVFGFAVAAPAAHIVIMAVEEPDNYDAVNSMRAFAERELRPLGHRVTLVEGDKPVKHHFAGLVEALRDADLLVLFSRRRFLPEEQMAAVRAHLNAGRPLLGIRTANHAFIPRPKDVVDPGLTIWPEFTREVLGGENTGYETKGLPYTRLGAAGSPLLAGALFAWLGNDQLLTVSVIMSLGSIVSLVLFLMLPERDGDAVVGAAPAEEAAEPY